MTDTVTDISNIPIYEIFVIPDGRKFQILPDKNGCQSCALMVDDLCQLIHGCSEYTRDDNTEIILKELT